jgi:predicted SAM-dependent methyltransferase
MSASNSRATGAPAHVLDRREQLLAMIDLHGRGLEIGPGFNPLLPKAEGYQVETLDHATQDELRAKYAGASGADTTRIETVDHVWRGGSLLQTIGAPARYDWIVASHVIEHLPDPLGFLFDCQQLMKPGGTLALAVPDKRHTFDLLRTLSSTGDMLQAHLERRQRHPPGRVFDELAYNVVREGRIAWGADEHGALAFFRTLDDARALYEHAQRTQEFIDIHGWQFTPSSFRLILSDLHGVGAIALRETAFHARSGEFLCGLSTTGCGPAEDRLRLAEQVIVEMQAIRAGTRVATAA